MASKKKLLTSAIALGIAAAMLLGGTFAWQSISQTALNEASDIVNPGGRLHNDLYYVDARTNDSNIYVENFADDEIFARVRLQEYMEIVMNYGTGAERVEVITGSKTPKADADVTAEDATSKDQFDYTYTTHQFGEEAVNDTADYFAWTMGAADSEAVYMPTFNVNKDSLAADLHGLYVDRVGGISSRGADQYTEEAWTVDDTKNGNEIYDGDTNSDDELKTLTIDELDALINDGTGADAYADHIQLVQAEHTAAAVGTTRGLISMEDWLALGEEADTDRYWVYDTDGWVYWSSPIAAHSTTGLLLDGFALQQVMDDTWYYAIQAEGQFITANDAGKENGTGFYASTEDQPSAEAETLLRTIGVDLGEDAGEGGEDPEESHVTVSVSASPDWYSVGSSMMPEITLTAFGNYFNSDPYEYTPFDSEVLSSAQWSIVGNSSADTKLSASTGESVTLTLGSDETAQFEVQAQLTYREETKSGSATIYNSPHIASMNLYDADTNPLLSTTYYKANTSNTYTVLMFDYYTGNVSLYDPESAFSGEIQSLLASDLEFSLVNSEYENVETLEGVTLIQDPENPAKITLTIAEGMTDRFGVEYSHGKGGMTASNRFAPAAALTSLTHEKDAEGKVMLGGYESTTFTLTGTAMEYGNLDISLTGYKEDGTETEIGEHFTVRQDWNAPEKVVVTHECGSTEDCECGELSYCILKVSAIGNESNVLTSSVQIWKAAPEETVTE